MSRASNLAGFSTSIQSVAPNNLVVGVITATSFVGDGSGLTGVGIGSTGNVNTSGIITASSFVGNLTGNSTGLSGTPNLNVGVVTATSFVGNVTGTATGLSGTPNITVGIVTSTSQIIGAAVTINASGINVTGVITASQISAGGTTGTSGQLLYSTGTGIGWTTASAGITQLDNVIGYNSAGIRSDSANGRLAVFGQGNFQVFTSPGSFVVNPGISSIRVRVVGAGGNGGNGAFPGPGGGGGGGGGGYAHKVITSFTAPRTYTVTVGSAPGGTSSFGSECSATGGSNGSNALTSPPNPAASGGAGGSGSSGDVNYTGATGSTGDVVNGNGLGGAGGAAATQKGNGSGKSVPGLPSINGLPDVFTGSGYEYMVTDGNFKDRNINRFPFDIFNGIEGLGGPSPTFPYIKNFPLKVSGIKDGIEGGGGGTGMDCPSPAPPTSPYWRAGGQGGTAGGGGGGGFQYGGQAGNPGGSGGYGGGGGGGGGGLGGQPAGSGGSGGSGIVIVEW